MISSLIIENNEKQLIIRLKQKNKSAFDYLYKRYSAIIYGLIIKIVLDEHICEDILQDVFVKIWTKIGQYNPAKDKLCTWVLNVARNAAIDVLRSNGEIMKRRVNMEAGCQIIVEMAYFNGYTMIDISKALQIPQETVKTRLREGVASLRA